MWLHVDFDVLDEAGDAGRRLTRKSGPTTSSWVVLIGELCRSDALSDAISPSTIQIVIPTQNIPNPWLIALRFRESATFDQRVVLPHAPAIVELAPCRRTGAKYLSTEMDL